MWKQPWTVCNEWAWLCSHKLYLWTRKFELHIIFSHVGKDDSSFDIFQPFKNKDIVSFWAVKRNRWRSGPHTHITIGKTHGWKGDWSSWTVVSQGWDHQRRIKKMDAREMQRYLMQIRYFATHYMQEIGEEVGVYAAPGFLVWWMMAPLATLQSPWKEAGVGELVMLSEQTWKSILQPLKCGHTWNRN